MSVDLPKSINFQHTKGHSEPQIFTVVPPLPEGEGRGEGVGLKASITSVVLLLRIRYSRTCSQIHYKALKVFVREKVMRKELPKK